MAQLISWDTCYKTFATQYMNANFEAIWVLIASLVVFFLFYIFKMLVTRQIIKLEESKAEWIAEQLILLGVLLLAGFLIYFLFFYQPGQVEVMSNQLADTAKSGLLFGEI